MDLTAMTDIELNTLMLDAGNELERRRTVRDVSGRLRKVMDDAADAGIPAADVDAAIVDAKARVQARAPLPPKPVAATPTKGTK